MMKLSYLRLLTMILTVGGALSWIAGCEDETTGLPGIPPEQFTEEFRGATCEHLVACNWMPDVQTCMGAIAQEPGLIQSVASANAGSLTYDPAAARTCVEAVRAAACTGDYLIPRSLRQTCDAVFGNRRGEGEACYHAAECQGLNATCEGSCNDRCCEGACRLEAGFAQVGESCAMKACVEGTYCKQDPDPTMPVCSNKVGPGESCAGATDACPLGYACDPSTETCFKQADPGGACNPDLAADGCYSIGEYCDATARKCLPYPGVGDACTSNAFGMNFCAYGYSYCEGGATVCRAMPKEGEPCPGNYCLGMDFPGIPAALECAGGTCVRLAAVPACTGP